MDYTNASTRDLLDALEQAGRTPSRALLEACLQRRDDLVSGLLERLEVGTDAAFEEEWGADDPRWFGEIHAGRLLIAFQEAQALPLFEAVLHEDDDALYLEWYEGELPHYGPSIIPMLTRLLQDETAVPPARSSSVLMLKDVALLHADAKPQVVETLRAVLPPLSDRGEPEVPEAVDEDQIVLYSFTALALAELGDTGAKQQVAALHDWYLVDEIIYGDYDAFLAMLEEDPEMPPPYDLVAAYEKQARTAQDWGETMEEEDLLGALDMLDETDEGSTSNSLLGYGGEATYIRETPKVGRNDPCPCGSGKKYKKCCGR